MVSDIEWQAVLDESYAHLDPDRREAERASLAARRAREATEDPLMWKAPRPEPEPPRRRRLDTRRAEPAPATDWTALETWLAPRLARERAMLLQVIGKGIGELIAAEQESSAKLSEQLAECRLECAKLGNEVAALREQNAVERGKLIDLPPLPARRVN